MSDLHFAAETGAGDSGPLGFLNLALDVFTAVNAPEPRAREGRRLAQLQILGARSGTPIPRIYGRIRIGGQLIWNGTPREIVSETGGDKGGGGTRTPVQRNYRYTLSFAIGLCEGIVNHIGRIWADGKILDLSRVDFRLHSGDSEQNPDPIIEAAMGAGHTPAYRGLAYIVFQDFDLTAFGNRIPQLTFEVFCPTGEISDTMRAAALLPGATEFGYHPKPHIQVLGIAQARGENLTAAWSRSDWDISIDALQESHPQCRDVALVVAWFGDDLRAAQCRLRPGVESQLKNTLPSQWRVAGLSRSEAHLVSYVDNRPAFGGTPSDESVVAAISDLRARGFRVLFYPFIMMDIPADNNLPSPYGGVQAAYPWRGRITCYPASGKAGSPDGTADIATDINHFVDGTHANDLYCLRGMVRHYATLCQQAGGVDAFLIGSELKGLSRLRTAHDQYPFAQKLVELAQLVRRKLPDTKISYAADWSEYGAYVPQAGSVAFPLDRFWGHSACDFVGIDAYFPLSDWRDGGTHLDATAGALAITDQNYLKSNMAGGEYYDWYYTDQAARDTQTRTSITDGLGEAWLYRAKDIKNWWAHDHRPRRNNVAQSKTAWSASMKPIWFTEVGCPAVDKGSNQPNVFPDRLSSEGGLPHYSNGLRDDHIQQAYLQAFTSHFETAEHNPVSSVYGEAMIPRDRIYFWAWDARPFPVFPYRTDVWADGDNWHTGHWLNGRQAVTPLSALLRSIAGSGGITPDIQNVVGVVDGYAIDRLASARQALDPLLAAYGLDVIGGSHQPRIIGRHHRPICDIDEDDILTRQGRPAFSITQADSATQINRFNLHYISAENSYAPQTATARVSGFDRPVGQAALPLVLSSYVAQEIAERLLYEARLRGTQARLDLPPAYIHLEVGDIIRLRARLWRITRLNLVGQHIEIEAAAFNAGLYSDAQQRKLPPPQLPTAISAPVAALPQPVMQIMDLPHELPPLAHLRAPVATPMLAATGTPWVESVLVKDTGNIWTQFIYRPATMGHTLETLPAAPIGRWDNSTTLEIELYYGALQSRPLHEVLAGHNMLAVQTPTGWEVIQFSTAELIGEGRYRLSGLLRGLKGSEAYMSAPLREGAALVLLNHAVVPLDAASETLPAELQLAYGPAALPEESYAWQTAQFSFMRAGLRCRAPVHIKMRRGTDDSCIFTWTRRSRVRGDDFDAVEIPLGEAQELYQIRILADMSEIYRTQIDRPTWTYPRNLRRTHEAAHPHAQWQLRIAQLSATQGAGHEAIYHPH